MVARFKLMKSVWQSGMHPQLGVRLGADQPWPKSLPSWASLPHLQIKVAELTNTAVLPSLRFSDFMTL